MGSYKGHYRDIDIGERDIEYEVKDHVGFITNMEVSSDEKFIVTSAADKSVKVFDLEEKKIVYAQFFVCDCKWILEERGEKEC